jgi:hypothetical protein
MKEAALLAVVLLLFGGAAMVPPIAQDDHHVTIDRRSIAGVLNGMDVLSNVLFFGVGIAGLTVTVERHDRALFRDRWTRWPRDVIGSDRNADFSSLMKRLTN